MFAIPFFKISAQAPYKKGEVVNGEDEIITKNRPFHVFVVHQISYPSQYRQYQMNVDDLKLLTVVGQGAFGTVFLGKMSTTNKYYGVKMLQKHKLLESDDNIANQKLEINTMKNVQHPNLMSIDFVKQ